MLLPTTATPLVVARCLRTIFRLGFFNIARVLVYRLKVSLGLLRFRQVGDPPLGLIFSTTSSSGVAKPWRQKLFGWLECEFSGPPCWHSNPFDNRALALDKLPCFDAMKAIPLGADVKDYWELSRFYWAPEMAMHASKGDEKYVELLNLWIMSWIEKNPPYLGINWACGQEASIRLLNLALAALVLNVVEKPTNLLRWMVLVHLRRIAPTLHYAIGQDNNHGSAEAVALYVGGSWLYKFCNVEEGRKYSLKGRRWLLDRSRILIQRDGTGNQYSTTYHRANLEVFSLAEIWRRRLGLDAFTTDFSQRLILGGKWLYQLTDAITGDAPNFGPNDGSHLFSLTRSEYRDFRPTVQLVAALFDNAIAYKKGIQFEDRSSVFNFYRPTREWVQPKSQTYSSGGHHVLRRGCIAAYFRYPKFQFRPGHADCLHVDLWVRGIAVLRDGGTYSYADSYANLGGVEGHNTVQFDGRDQMRKVGRFLYADWPSARNVKPVHETISCVTAAAGYVDAFGARHDRRLELYNHRMVCFDQLNGRSSKATLRWRLSDDAWELDGASVTNGSIRLCVFSLGAIQRFELKQGWESLYYRKIQPCQVLEVDVLAPTWIRTEVHF